MARRFQFSLRTIFCLVLVAAVLCLVAPRAINEYREYRQQRENDELITLILTAVEPLQSDPVESSRDEVNP